MALKIFMHKQNLANHPKISHGNASKPHANQLNPDANRQAYGLAAAFSAFFLWGILPIYWKTLADYSAMQILLFRIIASFVFLLFLVLLTKQLGPTLKVLKNKHLFPAFVFASLALSLNWLIYIWAVNSGHIVDASLGYFLTPLINTIFGLFFFKDRLSRLQWLSLCLAVLGVICQLVMLGRLPWISLALALSFGTYGMLRKKEPIESIPGLFLETLLLTPIALGLLVWFWANNSSGFFQIKLDFNIFLLASGIVTTVPLLFFAYGAKRLRLTSLGLMQYIAPTCQLFIGVVMYKEALSSGYLLSFAFIWAGLIIYSLESLRLYKRSRLATKKL